MHILIDATIKNQCIHNTCNLNIVIQNLIETLSNIPKLELTKEHCIQVQENDEYLKITFIP